MVLLQSSKKIFGSKIRGAFTVHKDPPAIYITKKNRRLGDIYFALLHELAHYKKDFNKAKSTSFISLEKELEQETKRDDQAFDWMIPEIYYKEITSNKNYDLAKETAYPKSFIAYRLAHDKLLPYSSEYYQKYNTIIGSTNL